MRERSEGREERGEGREEENSGEDRETERNKSIERETGKREVTGKEERIVTDFSEGFNVMSGWIP